ncbi:MAG: hypothetical protein QM703_10880 [Gemmatales bacterium]
MSTEPKPPASVSGKWIVIVMVPIILITFIWLAYIRQTFTHPTNIAPSHLKTQPSAP